MESLFVQVGAEDLQGAKHLQVLEVVVLRHVIYVTQGMHEH